MTRAMCGVQLKAEDLMLMLGFNETINQLTMSNSVQLDGVVLKREHGEVLGRALDYTVEG